MKFLKFLMMFQKMFFNSFITDLKNIIIQTGENDLYILYLTLISYSLCGLMGLVVVGGVRRVGGKGPEYENSLTAVGDGGPV